MKKNSILFILCFFSLSGVMAQEILPLHGNSILINYKAKNIAITQKSTSLTSSTLPFFDDFSYTGPFPDPAKWDFSQSIFVNHSYPIAPPTIGAATFDGLRRDGYPYNAAAQTGSAPSDSLISVAIRLDSIPSQHLSITPADSVYLSFYYEAKGRGDKPEQNDELRLYFFKDTINFSIPAIWIHSGYTNSMPVNDTGFHRVMIPITDTTYFKKGFRFAFRNFGTQSGAIDHWHVDQVYLNKGRTKADTVYADVSFVYDAKSLLKNYMQMPFNQFAGPADMDTLIKKVSLRNNNNIKTGSTWNGAVTITTEYAIFNNLGTQIAATPTVGTNVLPCYDSVGYCKDNALIKPSLGGFSYGVGPFADSASYLLKFYLKNYNNDTIHRNDTTYFFQDFKNYYSYDDGTAEGGYYIGGVGAETTVRYKLNVADTLRAFDVFFDPVFNVNVLLQDKIQLTVRADNNGVPGSIIYIDSLDASGNYLYPWYYHNGIDVFQRFQLNKRVPLAAGSTFYIGVVQQFTTGIGIGYDMNTDTHQNVFLNNGNGWVNPSYINKGSLMMRPILGDSARAMMNIQYSSAEKETFIIYPNPANDEISISSLNTISKVIISDLLGNNLLEEKNSDGKINVSMLPNGMYIINTISNKGTHATQKLIIAH